MISLEGTPYSLSGESIEGLSKEIKELQERVRLLRQNGKLTEATLRSYYGQKRFEQVAESNAIEGSTLSTGETELAIIKGVTLTGHDPAFVKDAVSLDRALNRIVELARTQNPTDITQLLDVHGLLLGDRDGAGMFRSVPVMISGSSHRPPRTWGDVMSGMEAWESWSKIQSDAAAIIRGSVLHSWLSHVHPFVDGNGRTARAITNLEFIRQGLPPVIIRRKERERYIDALAQSDDGGNLGPFLGLVIERSFDALLALERAAKQGQGYDPLEAKIRQTQEQRLRIWNTSLSLLYEMIVDRLRSSVEKHQGRIHVRQYSEALSLDDYIELCGSHSVSRSWAFKIRIEIPGVRMIERLAWIGFRSEAARTTLKQYETDGPSMFWSKPTTVFPYWVKCVGTDAPGPVEFTTRQGYGDEWYRSFQGESPSRTTTTSLAQEIATGFLNLVTNDG